MATFGSKTSLDFPQDRKPLFAARPRWPRKSAWFLLFLLALLLLVNLYQAIAGGGDMAAVGEAGDAVVQALKLP